MSHNIIVNNFGIVLILDNSVNNASLNVLENLFERNLLNIVCHIEKNEKDTKIKRNEFKIIVDPDEKTIKFAKKFSNLQFVDNQFIKLKLPGSDNNVWAKMLGFGNSHKESEIEDEVEMRRKKLRGPMIQKLNVLDFD